jgi:hypothetical protein
VQVGDTEPARFFGKGRLRCGRQDVSGVQRAERVSARVHPRVTVITCAYSDQCWDALVDAVASPPQ